MASTGSARDWPFSAAVTTALALLALALTALALQPAVAGGAFLRSAADDAAATGPFGAAKAAAGRIALLEEDNRRLGLYRLQAEELGVRVRDLEQLLQIPTAVARQDRVDFSAAVAARMVLDAGGPFTRTVLVNAGSDQGVALDHVALNREGLVGRVVAVGQHSSRVLLLDDYNSRVPVMGQSSRVRAVLVGQANQRPTLDLRTGWFGAARLDFVVDAGSLREGELMVTSGDGGVFPRGLPVGRAVRDGEGRWRIALGAAAKPIDVVLLIPFVAPSPLEAAVSEPAPPTPAGGGPLAAAAPATAPRRAPVPPPPPSPPPDRDDPDATPVDQPEPPQ